MTFHHDSPIISLEAVSKRYTSLRARADGKRGLLFRPKERVVVEALRGISFSVRAGERLALIGPNGAGKSTAIKIMTGLLEPTAGRAQVAGYTPWLERRSLLFQIGCVFGNLSQLWPYLPIADNLRLIGGMYGIESSILKRRINQLSERFGVTQLLYKRPAKLSLGERMKCEILSALLHQPKVLLLDEPSIGLDVLARLTLRQLIRELCKELGTTVVLTSHDTGDIEGVCERVIVVNQGTAVFDGGLADLRRRFSARKTISVIREEDSLSSLGNLDSQMKVKRVAECNFIISFDPGQISTDQAIAAVLAQGGIVDLTIGEPPLEEIIAEAFTLEKFTEGQCAR